MEKAERSYSLDFLKILATIAIIFHHFQQVADVKYDNFINFGITPIIIEPMPNALHDHIKAGDEKRDECIERR